VEVVGVETWELKKEPATGRYCNAKTYLDPSGKAEKSTTPELKTKGFPAEGL